MKGSQAMRGKVDGREKSVSRRLAGAELYGGEGGKPVSVAHERERASRELCLNGDMGCVLSTK